MALQFVKGLEFIDIKGSKFPCRNERLLFPPFLKKLIENKPGNLEVSTTKLTWPPGVFGDPVFGSNLFPCAHVSIRGILFLHATGETTPCDLSTSRGPFERWVSCENRSGGIDAPPHLRFDCCLGRGNEESTSEYRFPPATDYRRASRSEPPRRRVQCLEKVRQWRPGWYRGPVPVQNVLSFLWSHESRSAGR